MKQMHVAFVAALLPMVLCAPNVAKAGVADVTADTCSVSAATTAKWMPRIVHIRFRNAAAAAADDVEVTVAHAGTYADHGRFDQGATAEFDVRDAALNGMMPSRLACSVTAVHFVDGSRWTAQL